jgi:hypothetical protein
MSNWSSYPPQKTYNKLSLQRFCCLCLLAQIIYNNESTLTRQEQIKINNL